MDKIKLFFKPYISILFLRDYRVGIILFLLSFLLPSVGFLGITAIIVTILFAEVMEVRDFIFIILCLWEWALDIFLM